MRDVYLAAPANCHPRLNGPASLHNFLQLALPSSDHMPTYEFRCGAGHTFDRFLKMSEAPLELPCIECGKLATRQMSAGAGLVFKGSGFYLTDYGRAGQKPSGDAAVATSGDAKANDSKSSKSEPAAATPATPAAPSTTTPKSDKGSSTKSSKPGE